MVLRSFLESDDPALISWVRSPEELLLFGGPEMSWPLDRAQLAAIRLRSDTTAWTGVISPVAAAVGHIELMVTDEPERGHLARVIVDPDRRREGFGSKLVSAALDEALAGGLRLVSLNVRRQNEAAIRTYAGLGFRSVDSPASDPSVLRMEASLAAHNVPRRATGAGLKLELRYQEIELAIDRKCLRIRHNP
jgi:GNAT superfamily N-acetyltransferase